MLFAVLSKLPRPLDIEGHIRNTVEMFRKHPPQTLPGRAWSRISANSVLKTTHDFRSLSQQTLQDGEQYFDKQAAEIAKQEARQKALKLRKQQFQALARKYRRPATFTGVAVVVAIFALLAREYSLPLAAPGWSAAWLGLQQRIADLWQRL